MPSINSAVDINNFFSLQYEVPIGIYDSSNLEGPIEFTIGKKEESYEALNERNISLENKIISKDALGAFGSPYVDSNRAYVTEQTIEAVQFIYLKPSLSEEQAYKLTKSLSDMFIQIHGGEATYQVIN
ncbi:B3/4 domain-containing protein [Streptococcus pneumoniae]|nr:B3/4 domain-containing protein [Streptococcus pneumoniae]